MNKYVYDFLVILFLIVIVTVFYYFEDIKNEFYLRGAYQNLGKKMRKNE